TIDSSRGRSDCNSLTRLSPLTVRSYARPLRIKSGSPNISRSLSSARLMAGWLKKQRFAARVTCRSSKSACKASSKFRSTCRKCVWRMPIILTMHETTGARDYRMYRADSHVAVEEARERQGEFPVRNSTTKSAIITGASGGIGGAIAKRLAKDGFAVVVNYAGKAAPAQS